MEARQSSRAEVEEFWILMFVATPTPTGAEPNLATRPVAVVEIRFVTVMDVPVAAPMFGVIRVGVSAKTIAPEPVGASVVVIVKVPEVLIGPGVTCRNGGTRRFIDVTVPPYIPAPVKDLDIYIRHILY